MPSMTAPATSGFLQRIKSSYTTGSSILTTIPGEPAAIPTEVEVSPSPFSATAENLALLDQILTQVGEAAPVVSPTPMVSPLPEATPTAFPAQAVPLAVAQAPDPLNPTGAVGSPAKERFEVGVAPDTSVIDMGTGIQVLETERSQELPVEVEGYLQHVEDHQAQLPAEVVIATDMAQPYLPPKPLTPVVVLPITPEIEKSGGKKSPKFSVRWLVEWSRKLMKVFSGNVIYAESETT